MMSNVINRYLKAHKKIRKFSSQIEKQIKAVNDLSNPKSAFLFDLCHIEVDLLNLILKELKSKELICNDLKIVMLENEIFIANVKKISAKRKLFVIDISKNLETPKIFENVNELEKIIEKIQIKIQQEEGEIISFESFNHLSPTVFGFMINYPVLYYCALDENCLSDVELKVFQVYDDHESILMSFSIPNKIFNENIEIKNHIESFLALFKSHKIKSFITCQTNVIL